MNQEKVVAAFVNTEEGPKEKSEFYAYFVTEDLYGLSLFGIRTYYYDHPDASGYALLPVETQECIYRDVKPVDLEYPLLYGFLQASKAVKTFCREVVK